MELTEKQKQVYEFIGSYKRENGVSPLLSEIGREIGITRQSAFARVEAMIKKGYARRIENVTYRNLILIKKND